MKVLVTGGTGLLGWWLVKIATKRSYNVIATYNRTPPVNKDNVTWINLDISNFEQVSSIIERFKPSVILHSAAYTDVDGCETNREYALSVNYHGTANIVRSSMKSGSKLVYISTDYVFDGKKGMYRESDPPNPVNYYGLSKLLGEASIAPYIDNSAIIRVSGLYGYSPTGKRNFAVKALEKLLHGELVYAFEDQYLSPTYVPALAELVLDAVEKEVTGVIHIAGERMSRFEQARLIAEMLNVEKSLVKPVRLSELNLPAKRPVDSSLDTKRSEALGLVHPPARDSIKDFVKQYLSGASSVVGK